MEFHAAKVLAIKTLDGWRAEFLLDAWIPSVV
jgi:hypothetical protein